LRHRCQLSSCALPCHTARSRPRLVSAHPVRQVICAQGVSYREDGLYTHPPSCKIRHIHTVRILLSRCVCSYRERHVHAPLDGVLAPGAVVGRQTALQPPSNNHHTNHIRIFVGCRSPSWAAHWAAADRSTRQCFV
jgi:hypothetical protein